MSGDENRTRALIRNHRSAHCLLTRDGLTTHE